MKILRVFNNSVVLSVDELGRDVVLIGRGLGFQARPGDEVDESNIQRRFIPVDNAASVAEVLADISPEDLALIERLFGDAMRELGSATPALSVVAVADHIRQAFLRQRRGEQISYPMRAEVAHLHPKELELAERLLTDLNPHLPEPLPQGEAIALAMHLFHAATGSQGMSEAYAQSALIRQIFDLLADAYGPEFDRESIDAARFAVHLRYFFTRARTGQQLDTQGGAILGAEFATKEPTAYQQASHIRTLLELRLNQRVSDQELAYLTLHVARLEAGIRTRQPAKHKQ